MTLGKPGRKPLLILLFIIAAQAAFADYPLLKQLNRDDYIYRQLESDIREYYQASAKLEPLPSLQIFRYTVPENISLYALASSLNLYYESISTLNRLEKPLELPAGTTLLVPNIPGLFIPLDPANDLELMLFFREEELEGEKQRIVLGSKGSRNEFIFIPGQRFSKLELAFFLGILFRFPLPKGMITSLYGPRNSPVSGEHQFHGGIDIAAPMGTEVFAARDGIVIETGTHQVLGHYCILRHQGGYETVYAHLQSIAVELNQIVSSGMIIASLGNTGMSTGPHLHFEIRKNGAAVDPKTLLPRVKE